MLPKQLRLRRSRDIRLALQRGRVRRGAFLVFHLYQKGDGQRPRISVVVSGRVAKKATTRNRLKRQIRAAAAQWIAKTIDGGGYDTVIHAIPRRTAPTFTQIFKDFEQCLNQKTNARTAQWRATR